MECEERDPICSLCLTSCGRTFENIKLVTIEMLGILGLKLNSNLSGKPVICKTCSENLQKWFDFKTICVCTEDCINSFRDEGSNVKLDIGEIYLKKNETENIPAPKHHTVCRLCMEIAEADCYISLDDETKDTALVKAILARCFSELDLNTTENPVVCASCNSSLCSYFDFITKRFLAEEDIKKECEVEAENDESQGQSSNCAPQPCAEDILKYENGDPGTDMCKNFTDVKFEVCDDNVMDDELKSTKLKHENLPPDLHIKREVNESKVLDYNQIGKLSKALQFATRDLLLREHSYADMNVIGEFDEKKEDGEAELKREDLTKTEVDEFNILHEEVDLKTEEGSAAGSQDSSRVPKDDELRTHKGEGKDVFTQPHKNVSETTHSCEICRYTTTRKSNLKGHMLIHQSSSEVTTYSCEKCTYTTKRKSALKRHIMLVHKSLSEITTYSCGICSYTAKQKHHLTGHMLVHKNSSEVTTYSCEKCAFTTKRKSALKRHLLVHKSLFEIATYSCEICSYTAKQKCLLTLHMLVHKNSSEVSTYSCERCTYTTKRKSALKQHLLAHKSPSEITAYSCGICSYTAKRKSDITRHMSVHKNSSKVTTYSCERCSYKAKRKSDLNAHALIHRDFSEITRYSCDKAKRKSDFKEYMLVHKSSSKVTTYSCKICIYITKWKSNIRKHIMNHKLKYHMLNHKHSSDVTTYSCKICAYTTYRKSSFKQHMRIHHSSSEQGPP